MQHSLNASVLHLTHGETRIHLIDTPGAPDFLGQSLPALEAVETAAVVINAATGIEPMAVRMMEHAAARQRDRMIIVNKIDAPGRRPARRAGADPGRVRQGVPAAEPARRAAARGSSTASTTAHGRTATSAASMRRTARWSSRSSRSTPDFVDRYLNDGDVDAAELHAPLEQALREGHLIPVCFVSARSGAGVAELLDVIVKLLPNPAEANPPDVPARRGRRRPSRCAPRPTRRGTCWPTCSRSRSTPSSASSASSASTRARSRKDSLLYIGDGRKPFKVGHLFMLQGKDHVEVAQALPGDIVAVAKVDEIRFDAVLHDAAEDDHIHLAPLRFPEAGARPGDRAQAPRRRAAACGRSCTKLVDEDPCLKLEHVAGTNETVVYGLGELHLRMLLERLREVYRFEVNTRPPRIAYRETITAPAEGHHRHKKQSGGAGQFGEVFLRVEPLPRGAGFEFVDQVKGGTIPGQFIPAVEKGVREVLATGAIAGYPVVDVRVRRLRRQAPQRRQQGHRLRHRRPQGLHGGGARGAADRARADRQRRDHGAASRRSATSPATWRRGAAWSSGTANGAPGTMMVRGQAPMSELLGYQSRLNALTSGQGRYTIEFSHYEAVPPNMQQQLVGAVQGARRRLIASVSRARRRAPGAWCRRTAGRS